MFYLLSGSHCEKTKFFYKMYITLFHDEKHAFVGKRIFFGKIWFSVEAILIFFSEKCINDSQDFIMCLTLFFC